MKIKPRVLFLCTGNSCRSQMAEGWAGFLLSDMIDSCSAGTNPQPVNRWAVRVMAESGVDISKHTSKNADIFSGEKFNLVVTVCDSARERCPYFAGADRFLHQTFEDPPLLAANANSEEEILEIYRGVRDQIRDFVKGLPDQLALGES